jgi:hypothetical protein
MSDQGKRSFDADGSNKRQKQMYQHLFDYDNGIVSRQVSFVESFPSREFKLIEV